MKYAADTKLGGVIKAWKWDVTWQEQVTIRAGVMNTARVHGYCPAPPPGTGHQRLKCPRGCYQALSRSKCAQC